MGLLNGGIRSIFNSAFSALYLPANLTRVTLTPDGEGGFSEFTSETAVRVQQDTITDQMRISGGYSENDARFLILQDGTTEVTSDCRLTFEGVTYLLSNPQQDPARSYWAVRATPQSGDHFG